MNNTEFGNTTLSVFLFFGVRVLIGFFFFSIGRIFHMFEDVLHNIFVKPYMLFVLFLAVDIIQVYSGGLTYNLLFNDIGQSDGFGTVIAHIISTLCIIIIIYIIGYYFSLILDEKAFIYKIGQNSFMIMVFHFTAFWIVNFVFYKIGIVKFEDLSNVYFKAYLEKTWLIYTAFGIIFPMAVGEVFRHFRWSLSQLIKLLYKRLPKYKGFELRPKLK